MGSFGPSEHKAQTALTGSKTGVVQAVQPSLISPHTSLFENFLTRAGYKESLGPPGPLDHDLDADLSADVALTIAPRLPGKRWTASDEAACTAKCKRCSQPIIWGQCDTDSRKGSPDVGRWFPLDPDMGLHGCGSGVAYPAKTNPPLYEYRPFADKRKENEDTEGVEDDG